MSTRACSPALRAARAAIPLALLGAIAIWGCRPAPGVRTSVAPAAGREILITDSEIVRMSVRTAWDAVRLRAPHLTFAQGSGGAATHVMIQAPRSITADETPLLVVDGMQVADVGYLNEIPASSIHAIHILSSEAAEPLYGLAAAGGAIVVETKRGLQRRP